MVRTRMLFNNPKNCFITKNNTIHKVDKTNDGHIIYDKNKHRMISCDKVSQYDKCTKCFSNE